ncbi:MAG: hypothetical protein A3J10_01195 [Candidatus Sungbacteria bacterium RIFCSPLOWO2_02_FULL_54_10]|uniref:Thioredoxin domain-containing protein n=2 Tax=Candidatus Sungiibacteriota TaxID=1817917 RepID=A0A1G2L8T0_9BACT|nr:MAG: hypothetical protein A2679_00985 [Candidatus Sungbacteria bacterium RIFCSPHIGHO2_01_FULL_54_26]OHA03471.1 MAG: hypothetical protein A3C92_02415 [Candidatus Sungbacteria bacterium RIFCSPHIGHO2_02_FULL_53_17]OHA07179.1 MAG: hypothetical protein A3B34_04000 [Candidatus Sungbacteria bacterium RIFCSPLOWO2_01_FULL_54_21]OHA12744.1 MAG: hypothetical protein A3J10_01195 [Candidatus Sungbacteria bacterium RIFCSPLOWO2_02_FULL_54_10]
MEESQSVREETSASREAANPYVIPISILVAGGLIAGAVLYSNGSGVVSAPADQQAVTGTAATGDLVDDDPILGNPDAPVTLVEFSDFQCPFCRRFYQETLPQIKKEYLQTGRAKLVYRDFPLVQIHPGALPAAEGTQCAHEQGKFWEMHDAIFDEQEKQGSGTVQFTADDVKRWAASIGLNASQFNACLDSRKYQQEVEKDIADGSAAGVSGTPATFINGRLVSGAQPFAAFKAIIEEELAKLKK